MAAVQEENQRKNEELKQLKNQIASVSGPSSPSHRPIPPPFPPQLARYTQAAEQDAPQSTHTIASPVIQPLKSPSSPVSPLEQRDKPALPPPLQSNPISPSKQRKLEGHAAINRNSKPKRSSTLLTEIQEAARVVKLRKVPKFVSPHGAYGIETRMERRFESRHHPFVSPA